MCGKLAFVPDRLRRALEGSALSIALLRVAVVVVVLLSPELHAARRLVAEPSGFVFVPEGMRLLARVPWTPSLAHALYVVALSSGATALLGFAARASMLAFTLSAGLLFSLSQRQGAVLHDMHLFWLTALLAASPCGDALSVDAWGEPVPPRSLRYGVPAAFARALLGAVYLFPGLHKLVASGLAWASPTNLTGHLWAKWLEHGTTASFRIDEHPWLLAAGGVFVLVFELSFGVLALASRTTRAVAIASGLVFHAATQALFFIPFPSLWACYVVLLDPRRGGEDPDDRPPLASSVLVGALLLSLVLVQGVRGHTQAWPFACYPTFEHMQPAHIPDLVVEVVEPDGTTVRLSDRTRRTRSQAAWGHVFRISGAYGDRPDVAALARWGREVALGAGLGLPQVTLPPGQGLGLPLEPARTLRLYRVEVDTAPSLWGGLPGGGVLLTELPLP